VTLELIAGEIRESPMTTRSPQHSMAIALISRVLLNWLDDQTDKKGVVAAGEACCRILPDPETMVGIDVAYFETDASAEQADGGRYFDGPPVVAVEVLSSSGIHECVIDRIRQLVGAGVSQVWIADPVYRAVTVHRPDSEPKLLFSGQVLTGDPELPGLAVPVEQLFGR
jgi:Uma2 family endonuclease